MNLDNLDHSQLPNLVYLSILLISLIFSVILKKNVKTIEVLKQATTWLIIILLLLIVYSFRYSFILAKNRITAELFPSKARIINNNQLIIQNADDGHFYIDAKINNQKIRFMVDTGASDISLTLKDAKKIGINVNKISSFRRYQTANGEIISGLSQVKEMEISGVKFYDIGVSINNGNMSNSLLGMSFLRKFKKYEFYQDKMILTY